MGQILCSTGALIGRPNGRNYRLLSEFAPQLSCDGFEFLMYESWYDELETLLAFIKPLGLNIPVVHCDKFIGESLCGLKAGYTSSGYYEKQLSEDEDRLCFQNGLLQFDRNLKLANELGAGKMVLHLWNGVASDKRIEKNIERFGILQSRAQRAGVLLMVENVVCNTRDPLTNLRMVREAYPDVALVYDTKMAEFHRQTMQVFSPEWDWVFTEGHVRHLHVNDYNGGYMDWSNLRVLPIGAGRIDFAAVFQKLAEYGYSGDYTVEATAFDRNGAVDLEMLNRCFAGLRELSCCLT